MDRLEERQDNLDRLVAVVSGMQAGLRHTQEAVEEIKGDVKAMMEAPGRRWDAAVAAAVAGVVSAIIGAAMALILK